MTHMENVEILHKKPERSFYTAWVLLTCLCIPIAFFLNLFVMRIITIFVGDFIYVNGVQHITEDYLFLYTLVPMVGLLTGVLQYGLLRRFLPRMGWWVPATFGGWILGVLLIAIFIRLNWMEASLDLDLVFILMGLAIGVGQWLLLRLRLPRAGWWVAANLLGWGLLGLVTTGNTMHQYGLFTISLFPGCIMAAFLALLMKQAVHSGLQGG